MSCPYQLWLAAFDDQIPDRELYAYWNLKDELTPRLDAALATATYLYVGSWSDEHEGQEPQVPRAVSSTGCTGAGRCLSSALRF